MISSKTLMNPPLGTYRCVVEAVCLLSVPLFFRKKPRDSSVEWVLFILTPGGLSMLPCCLSSMMFSTAGCFLLYYRTSLTEVVLLAFKIEGEPFQPCIIHEAR